MRNTILLVTMLAAASTVHANPTTQACLGNIDTFLSCPAGAQRSGTECRTREPNRGQGAGEHWSGSKRQGPSVFMRDAKTVSFAASYKDHKKTGRAYRFDKQGVLQSWSDLANDEYHGLSVTCLPDGRVSYLANFKDGRIVGISRAWRTKDGSFSYAMEYDAQGHPHKVTATPAMQKRPDHLCQPQRCDVNAAPDLSGIPTP